MWEKAGKKGPFEEVSFGMEPSFAGGTAAQLQ